MLYNDALNVASIDVNYDVQGSGSSESNVTHKSIKHKVKSFFKSGVKSGVKSFFKSGVKSGVKSVTTDTFNTAVDTTDTVNTDTVNNTEDAIPFLGLFGSLYEWFDFASFASMSPEIGAAFFPNDSSQDQLLYTMLIFSMSFVLHPLGALIFGEIG